MKRLFAENDRYNEEGQRLSQEASGFLHALVEGWVRRGFSARDIQLILQMDVMDACLTQILDSSNYREETL